MTANDGGPWWASGASADDGIDGADPFDAHRRARGAREGGASGDGGPGGNGARGTNGAAGGDGPDTRWVGDAVDAVMRLAAAAGRRIGEDAPSEPGAAPHPDGVVCDACPVCLALRAVRQVRPEVIGHLSDAAHHLSLALRAIAEAQAGEGPRGFEHIDLDP